MTTSFYEYSQGDLLDDPLTYAYSAFQGAPFLAAWRAARAEIRDSLVAPQPPKEAEKLVASPKGEVVETASLLDFLFAAEEDLGSARHWLSWLIKRFEVSKRLHSCYTLSGGRARGNGIYCDMNLYLRLADVLTRRAQQNGHLPSLNALLKCLDILCSRAKNLNATQKARLSWLLEAEDQLVEIVRKLPVGATAVIDPPSRPSQLLGTFPRVAFLAADTVRSRGYAQALVAHGVRLGRVVIVKVSGDARRWGQCDMTPSSGASLGGYFVPNLDIPLGETCQALSDDVILLETGTVNAPEVVATLSANDYDFAIYSGFGGELVSCEVLEGCAPLLHMHAGWLPDYRGSTTTFFSWLRDGNCGVSAILLNAKIDQGVILGRKRYPPPTAGMDSDYLYDAVLRSDLLLFLIEHLAIAGKLPSATQQEADEGETYYIIHPVLKHLAILGGQ